jgi:transcriptional regulator with XRE-family HTH domain
MEEAGQRLRRVRERLHLTLRDVVDASSRIAARHGNDEFSVVLSGMSNIEKGIVPSVYKLYSLCAIYRLEINEVLGWYGVSPATLVGDADVIQHANTHVIGFQPEGGEIQSPVALDPGLDLSRTVFLSRLFQRWGKLPLMLLNNLDLKNFRYGYIGSEDWSMHPLLPAGSLVVIDDSKRKIVSSGWTSEYDRPIYFLEHTNGYACGWCSVQEGQIIVQYHPASGYQPEIYAAETEIQVIGQVTLAATMLGLLPPARS